MNDNNKAVIYVSNRNLKQRIIRYFEAIDRIPVGALL